MDPREAVRRELEVLSRQDVEGVLSFYTEDVVFEDISSEEPLRGKQAMREFMEGFYAAFPDARIEPEAVFGDERTVCAEYHLLGTHRGEFEGRAPTGKSFRLRAASVYEWNGERFTRETFYWDSASLLRQLGLS